MVKFARWAFEKFKDAEDKLGTQMRAVGEVMSIADSFGLAFFKAEQAAQQLLPIDGTVLITVAEKDRSMVDVAKQFRELGFKIIATQSTHQFLTSKDITSESILKMHEGRPNIVDAIMNGSIKLIINTPSGKLSQYDDSYIRKAAINYKAPYITTLAAAIATARGISAYKQGNPVVKSLQNYHTDIE